MADLEQLPGELNLQFVAGDDLVFTAAFTGDISAYTHTAFVYSGSKLIATFTVTDSYTDPTTTVTFTLTDTQTLISSIPLTWKYIQDNAGDKRTILAGNVTVVK